LSKVEFLDGKTREPDEYPRHVLRARHPVAGAA